jgi:hypothetical protein
METTPSLSSREVGALPISIGTSLAIESILGILPEHETDKPAINETDLLWINVRTLYRNLMGAVDKTVRPQLLPSEIAEAIINEMQSIEAAIAHQTMGKVAVTFYHCSYYSTSRKFPHALHKAPNTPLQKEGFLLEQLTMRSIIETQPANDFREFDLDFDGDPSRRVFIVTHYAIDLLNRYRFKSMTLLETHTGALKPPSRWYTKLHDGKSLYNIPFDRMTLQVFGDGNMFSPAPIKIRKFMVTLAEKYNWTSVTTKDYITKSIKDEKDPVLESYVLRMY